MQGERIEVASSTVLVPPDVDRDPAISLGWLENHQAKFLMQMMNVEVKSDFEITLQNEKNRITHFINRDDQIVWMIEYEGKIVGSIWADIKTEDHLDPPVVCLMLGEQQKRNSGIGEQSTTAVLQWCKDQGYSRAYARAVLVSNEAAIKLLSKMGYEKYGKSRVNHNNEEIQDFVIDLEHFVLEGHDK